jgi:hypothetical protein
MTQCLKYSPCISELDTQLFSETGQDILTISFGDSGPVLYHVGRFILLLQVAAVPCTISTV